LGHEQVFAPLAYQSDARTMTHDYTRHGTITLFALGRFGAAIVDQRSADFPFGSVQQVSSLILGHPIRISTVLCVAFVAFINRAEVGL
jgi:hypothetical protein